MDGWDDGRDAPRVEGRLGPLSRRLLLETQAGDESIRDQALSQGVAVLGPAWVEDSYNNGSWVPEKEYAVTPSGWGASSTLRYLLHSRGSKRKRVSAGCLFLRQCKA